MARRNADAIISGDEKRFIRTDDLGRMNDRILDVLGQEIVGQGAQMKYVGGTPEELLSKIRSAKYRKYLEADALLDIPDDFYEKLADRGQAKGIVSQKINELQKEIDVLAKSGDPAAFGQP